LLLKKESYLIVQKKFSVEKLNRGGLLFEFEAPAIVFGFFLIHLSNNVGFLCINTNKQVDVLLYDIYRPLDHFFHRKWCVCFPSRWDTDGRVLVWYMVYIRTDKRELLFKRLQGVGWATVMMLLCAGTFELNLANIFRGKEKWKSYRLGVRDSDRVTLSFYCHQLVIYLENIFFSKLVDSRKKQNARHYFLELRRFLTSFCITFLVTR
jgi:hypothetical protein